MTPADIERIDARIRNSVWARKPKLRRRFLATLDDLVVGAFVAAAVLAVCFPLIGMVIAAVLKGYRAWVAQ